MFPGPATGMVGWRKAVVRRQRRTLGASSPSACSAALFGLKHQRARPRAETVVEIVRHGAPLQHHLGTWSVGRELGKTAQDGESRR